MKLTILETGRPPGGLKERFSAYPEMFETLFSRAGRGFEYEVVSVCDGVEVPDPHKMQAILIGGSPSSVYDSDEWIAPLKDFVRQAAQARVPTVGICFGHQIIADALGGDVRKSEKGWGVGRHSYEIGERPAWMRDAGETFALSVSHQDQVITPPSGAKTLARSAHTDHALIEYTTAPMLSFQGHPEFSDTYSIALYSERRATLGDELADQAIESLAHPDDNDLVAEWMADFLMSAG